jgi:hypothetical protein
MVFYFILSLLGNFFSTLGLIEAAKKVYKTLIKILEYFSFIVAVSFIGGGNQSIC